MTILIRRASPLRREARGLPNEGLSETYFTLSRGRTIDPDRLVTLVLVSENRRRGAAFSAPGVAVGDSSWPI